MENPARCLDERRRAREFGVKADFACVLFPSLTSFATYVAV